MPGGQGRADRRGCFWPPVRTPAAPGPDSSFIEFIFHPGIFMDRGGISKPRLKESANLKESSDRRAWAEEKPRCAVDALESSV